ncbi:MAG: hypothetical protein FIB08_04965 [Candidatus Methanoperedens sp.]|nr:hypothetical protein [Candidatus Methanoperedens sp.]
MTTIKTIGESGAKVFKCDRSDLGEGIIFVDEEHTLREWRISAVMNNLEEKWKELMMKRKNITYL